MIFKGVATMSWALPVYYGYKRIQKPLNFSTQLLEKPMKWWTTMISPFFLRRLATKHSSWLHKILWLLKSFTRLQGWFMNFWILTLDLRSRTGRLATIHQWAQGMQEMLTLASKLKTKFLDNSMDIYLVERCDCFIIYCKIFWHGVVQGCSSYYYSIEFCIAYRYQSSSCVCHHFVR